MTKRSDNCSAQKSGDEQVVTNVIKEAVFAVFKERVKHKRILLMNEQNYHNWEATFSSVNDNSDLISETMHTLLTLKKQKRTRLAAMCLCSAV